MTKQELAEMYRGFLEEEGYVPKIDGDGDVTFKYEGGVYFIAVDEKDEEFFRLVFPNFWSIESEAEREKVAKAALRATADTKVAKVFPVRDNTWASIEMFCSPPDVFKAVFQRSLRALKASIENFREAMSSEILSSALTIENSLLDQQKQGKNMERRQKMERTIVNNGSLMDVRIGIIRQDYNPVLHGSEISFYDHEPPLFQRMDGEIIPDIVRETAILRVFGFDEPEDGCAFELTCDGVSDTISGCVFGDNESLYEMIKNALLKHITSSNDVAESIVNILSTAYGYGFDSEEIQEEAFDTLENVKYLVEFDGAEMLYLYDSEFAGGIFVEVNPFNNIPCTIENNGKFTFSEDIDWDEYREESERFVFVIRGH